MKTPDEIKKGLECVGGLIEPCVSGCPYEKSCECGLTAARDAIEYIQQLETRLAQVESERNVALSEWKRTKMDSEGMCWTCKHGLITRIGSCRCVSPDPCDDGENWEWRGVCEENTHDQPGL